MALHTAGSVPIQTAHLLRTALLHKGTSASAANPTTTTITDVPPAAGCPQKRKRMELLASMDAGMVANLIIKDEAADRRLHALAIARRLRYCLCT
jgi:hypothetical protein